VWRVHQVKAARNLNFCINRHGIVGVPYSVKNCLNSQQWDQLPIKKLRGLCLRANYTDRATAACQRSQCQLLADRGCRVVSATDPYDRILGFIDRSRYFLFLVAPQLYSRGWVVTVPDPLLLRKSASDWNWTRISGSAARNSDHQTTDPVHPWHTENQHTFNVPISQSLFTPHGSWFHIR
jgi:hypothetical protein